jgi:hypothetical protein
MGDRLIISDNREDPGNPLVLDGEAIDAAARDPLSIGKLMVDQVWAEGTDPTGGGLYYERNSNQHRRLQAFETGSVHDRWLGTGAGQRRAGPQGASWHGACRKSWPGEDPWLPPGCAAGGVPGRSLGLSNRHRAPVAGASLALMGEGEGPKFPRAAARPAGHSALNLAVLLISFPIHQRIVSRFNTPTRGLHPCLR